MKLVTVVYEIANEEEWKKTNPLHYTHHGLRATRCAVGDCVESAMALAKLGKRFGELKAEVNRAIGFFA